MEDLFGIDARCKVVADNIQKAFGAGYEANPETSENAEENIQKGRVGVYEDNAENRRLNRVGQQYGEKKEEEMPKGKIQAKKEDEPNDKKGASEKQNMSSHAAKASDGALKRAAADEKAPEDVRNAAKEELKKRGGSEDKEKLAKEFMENAKKEFEKKFPGMKFDVNSSAKSDKDSKEDEKKEEDFEDISTDIDSIAYYMADNPKQDESGNKTKYKDGDIQEKIVEEHGVKIRKLVEKYGKGETISMISKNSDTFDKIRSRRLVNACLKSE